MYSLILTKGYIICVAEVIKGDGKEIPDVIKKWVEHYERNQKSAMAEILTVLFEVHYIFGIINNLFLVSTLCIPYFRFSWAGMRSQASSSGGGCG